MLIYIKGSFIKPLYKTSREGIFCSKTYFQMWYEIANQIVDKKSKVSICRYGDGEYAIILGKPFDGKDHPAYKGGKSRISEELFKSLKCPSNGICYYGVWINNLYEFIKWSNRGPQFFTTSNIFCNKNYPKTKLLFESIIHDEKNEIILFCNKKAKNTSFAKLVYYFPDYISSFYEKNYNIIIKNVRSIAKNYSYHVFMLSVGPLSPVLIYHMRLANINNRYVDFGSTMDELIKGYSNRKYVNPNSKNGNLIDKSFILKNNSITFFQ